MVYETRNHWFIKDDGEKIEITNLEHKTLIILARKFKKLVTYEELAKSLYDTEVKYVMNPIRANKRRLKEKTGLKIRTEKGKGYILETEIYFK